MPAPGTPARGEATKWLVWMSTTLQTTLMHHFYPARLLGDAYMAAHPEVAAQVSALSAVLGAPVGVGGAHVVWDLACRSPLPDDLAPCLPMGSAFSADPARLADPAWAHAPARTEWEQRLIDRGRVPSGPTPPR
jgi:hypothetical protein